MYLATVPSPLRHLLRCALIILSLGGLAGCVRRQTDAFPWGNALQAGDTASAEVDGTYLNVGRASWSPGAPVQLYGRFFSGPALSDPPQALRIRLRREATASLRVEVLRDGQVIASQTLTVQPVADDQAGRGDALRLEHPTKSGPTNLGVGWDSGRVNFRRGADGCLYAEVHSSGGGLLFYVVPFYGASTHWMRWEPATQD